MLDDILNLASKIFTEPINVFSSGVVAALIGNFG